MSLIDKYKISEKDLYTISCIEVQKKSVGFFKKEMLKTKTLGVLKPYKIGFMDLGKLIDEIKANNYDQNEDFKNKFGEIQIDLQQSSSGMKYVSQIFIGILAVCFLVYMFSGESSFDEKECLVGHDWIYPSSGRTVGAFKFSSDGTFNQSNTTFGGMTSWGNWSVIGEGEIAVSYTRSTRGTLPSDNVFTLTSCDNLLVGSTNYSKD